ncbi:MAG: MBL fold metallo-hydrolase [Clostridiales bacterium]|nr:MBL fold metallo-hydrolase [Clostridiales bacterium]
MKRKVKTAAMLLLAALVFCLAACGEKKPKDNSAKYGAPVEFEGPPHEVSVMFVNVGKADCAVVMVDGHTWLVDTGTEESFIKTFAALKLLGAETIDGVILSHGHSDHSGGLAPISESFPIGRVCYPGYLIDRDRIASMIADLGLVGAAVSVGDRIGVTEGVSFLALAPLTLNVNDDNDNSLVLMLEVNGRRCLFTGDMQFAEDGELVASGADISCDVLKVPNHGNPDAVSEAFANAAKPLISVTSTDTGVDANSANRRVLAKLGMSDNFITENYGMGVLVTVSPRGEIALTFPEQPEAAKTGLSVSEADKPGQFLTIKNEGAEAADISGWFVYSSKGFETFRFPNGTVVPAGGSITVACKNSAAAQYADLIWNKKKIFADKKEDSAVLCDPFGNEISRLISQ